VKGATKDLINELREQMEDQITRWTLNDILMCSVTPLYAGFARLTPDEALAKSDPGAATVSGTPDHLTLASHDAPGFCQRAQFVLSPEHQIVGFEVLASRADALDVNEVIQHAEQFDFTSGRYAGSDQTYFIAQSKDKKILIQYDVENHQLELSRVSYSY
jgi:hypothetical protein